MAPIRKAKSIYRRDPYVNNEESPTKDGGDSAANAKKPNTRKRKLADMLGHRWTTEELSRFYDAYRKHGKEWKKVAGAVRNRSPEMAETLYTMNRAYLALPHGTASAAGLIAMMTDHYSNLAESDSDHESNDGAGSSRKTQKRARGKVPPTTSKALDEPFVSLSLLKKKRSAGSSRRPVGKRTPRIPVASSYENNKGGKYISPTSQGLKIKATANDDEVEVAIALAEASQRGGSPQVSRTPSKRAESVMSSPFRHAQRKQSAAEIAHAKLLVAEMDDDDLEGSAEVGTVELSRYRKKVEQKVDSESHLDDITDEHSKTREGPRLRAMRGMFDIADTDTKNSRSAMQSRRKKSKKVLFGADEDHAFDALQTLADLSLMMPTENENVSEAQNKDEDVDHVDESLSLQLRPNQQKEKHRSAGVRTKGHQALSNKISKYGKTSIFSASYVEEDNQNQQIITKTSRRKQKVQAFEIQKSETHPDVPPCEYPEIEVGDAGKKIMTKAKKSLKSNSPKLSKVSENSSSSDLPKERSDSAQSAAHAPVVNQVTLLTKARSRRKTTPKKQEFQKDTKYPDKLSGHLSNLPFASLPDGVISTKEKLSSSLSYQLLRRWCTYEWFYSAIDYPWFAKKEFVEYLHHVGLGHVPRLTRVEWGVIRSSLGKPRRFSVQFLKEEKEKLNQYRDSVRKHYTELREGVREGLPTDLAKPLSVGQRVIAIHPKTREIHDGSVLTVDHFRCRVQFDCPELGVEFIQDLDCMPLNPCENVPALFGRHTVAVDKFFGNFNELKVNGGNRDNVDGISELSALVKPADLKQTEVATMNAYSKMDSATYQLTPHTQPNSVAWTQSKEADIHVLAKLTRALDKKEAIVLELRRMNDDVSKNQKDGCSSLKDSDSFMKQYAAVLVKLKETNEQVNSAIHCLKDRNTYQENSTMTWPRPSFNLTDRAAMLSCVERSACETIESGTQVNEITDGSRSKAQIMVNAAMQAMSSVEVKEGSFEKIEEVIDYVNDRLPSDDSSMTVVTDHKTIIASDVDAQIPSDLITKCVATLLMIQKCTERQFPPSDVAQILDSAVTSLQPSSPNNLPVYTEIQKCMGIIRNQILALIPA